MASIKISELPAANTPLTGAELMELSQLSGGVYGSVQASAQQVAYGGAKYGSFYDTTDQTGSTSAATPATCTRTSTARAVAPRGRMLSWLADSPQAQMHCTLVKMDSGGRPPKKQGFSEL